MPSACYCPALFSGGRSQGLLSQDLKTVSLDPSLEGCQLYLFRTIHWCGKSRGLVIPLNTKHMLKTSKHTMSSGRKGKHVFHVIWMSQKSTLGTTSSSQRSKAPWSTNTDMKGQLIQQNPIYILPYACNSYTFLTRLPCTSPSYKMQ